jgi:hypothetical protein
MAMHLHILSNCSLTALSRRTRRIQHLDTLVDLSPGTFTQYQTLQAKKWWSETFPKSKKKPEERHCDDDYFDTYQKFPVETGDHFFDTEQELEFDENENLCYVLNLDSIYKSRAIVNFTGGLACDPTQEEKDTQTNLAPSEWALQTLLDSTILSPVALTTTDILAQIIFDTGASLAISPHRSDFDDNPTPLSTPIQLGGMGKGLQIEGIDFGLTTYQVLKYVYSAHKSFLKKEEGVFGHFHGNEDKLTVKIGNCPEIEIHYCTKSGLPIAEAQCGLLSNPSKSFRTR